MAEYPIPVRQYDGDQALAVICEKCGDEWQAAEDMSDTSPDCIWCSQCESWGAVFKYAEGDVCGNCGRLGWLFDIWSDHRSWCSRACKLQGEYAATLPPKE